MVLFCITCLQLPLITAIDSHWEGQKVMGCTGHALGSLLQDPPNTCGIVFLAYLQFLLWKRGTKWRSLIFSPLLPNINITSGQLAFMHTYPPNDTTLSSLLGGKDPKTIHKYMWPYIEPLAELENFVVSWLLLLLLFQWTTIHISLTPCNRLILKTGRRETS